jgi:hypothetical protein
MKTELLEDVELLLPNTTRTFTKTCHQLKSQILDLYQSQIQMLLLLMIRCLLMLQCSREIQSHLWVLKCLRWVIRQIKCPLWGIQWIKCPLWGWVKFLKWVLQLHKVMAWTMHLQECLSWGPQQVCNFSQWVFSSNLWAAWVCSSQWGCSNNLWVCSNNLWVCSSPAWEEMLWAHLWGVLQSYPKHSQANSGNMETKDK